MNVDGNGEGPTLLILAGGESRRMGRSKLLLPVPPRGIPLIRRVAERLLPLAARVVVVANDAEVCHALRDLGRLREDRQIGRTAAGAPVDCLPDDEQGHGPLAGLATGLRRVDGWALTVAGDMPFVSAAVCRQLIGLADGGCDAVVPVHDGLAQPLHALYHRRCLRAVEQALAARLRRMDSFWPKARVRRVSSCVLRACDPELRTFVNVNTPSEWDDALALLSRG